MGLSTIVRGVLVASGVLLVVTGFGTLAVASAAGPGLWLILSGGVLLIVAVFERNRYRSEAADGANDPVGPGGGETGGPVEPRFRPTAEVFVDPTTRRRMRVLVDPQTGERRYVAEA